MSSSAAKATILIVDDEPAILGLAEATLVDSDYTVRTATSGAEALELCAGDGSRPDAILIDVVMPEMSGPELAVKIREILPQVPCIFTSGYGGAAGVALKQSNPNAHYLKKPFSPDQLVEAIEAVLPS